MPNEEHLAILEQGAEAWNDWRDERPEILPDLSGAHLRGIDLFGANLRHAEISNAVLRNVDLGSADFSNASIYATDLSGANLKLANFSDAELRKVNLSGADLSKADLTFANLEVNIEGANLQESIIGDTVFSCSGLHVARNLPGVQPIADSIVARYTLKESSGLLPDDFLRKCGLSEWEIHSAKLYNPKLSAEEVTNIQQMIFDERMKGYFLCGIFISYSYSDEAFVDTLYDLLKKQKVNVWLDRHDLVAGPISRQVQSAIRINDIVLLVLSKDSIRSPWVTWELKRALREKDKHGRDILCPIALDDSWKAAAEIDPQWDVVRDYKILDFSNWRDKGAFEREFGKLLEGVKRYYSDVPDLSKMDRTRGPSADKSQEVDVNRFQELLAEWKSATKFSSSATEISMHSAYQQIIGMGRPAIPLILKSLREKPDHWFWALKSITGEDPVPESSRGNMPGMQETWLAWGRDKGYL